MFLLTNVTSPDFRKKTRFLKKKHCKVHGNSWFFNILVRLAEKNKMNGGVYFFLRGEAFTVQFKNATVTVIVLTIILEKYY